MKVKMIEMSRIAAHAAVLEYRSAIEGGGTKDDRVLLKAYSALERGRRLIDVRQVMKATGVDERVRPKLAISRASAEHCWYQWQNGGALFWWKDGAKYYHWPRCKLRLPFGTLPPAQVNQTSHCLVPSIPPRLRPKNLDPYFILWEADWDDAPVDPILLRHLDGPLFVVLAGWDLTEVERSILSKRNDP
jgi:hypothetical protein